MDVELVAQMFKNYRSNVLFHLEGEFSLSILKSNTLTLDRMPLLTIDVATDKLSDPS